MMRKSTVLLLLVFLAGIATGCGEDASDGESSEGVKGAEEESLTELGKADSFFKPTEQGELFFGTPNTAVIEEDARFHAWTFSLSEGASLSIKTELGDKNLDTVMYLYQRESSDASWGRFLKKNDDHQGNIWSQIDVADAKAGEYRVIVKAFKKAMRGQFTLVAECTGAGCARPDAGTCDPEVSATSPSETAYGSTCAADVTAILAEPATNNIAFGAQFKDKCDLEPSIALAMDYYQEYWDGLIGWEDFIFDDPEDVFLNISFSKHGAMGSRVSVDIGADEDTLIFVFDGDDDLVMYYHDEQSPTAAWACAEPGDSDADHPDEDCVAGALYGFPHSASEVSQVSDKTTPDATDTSAAVQVAVKSFAASQGLAGDAEVAFVANAWKSLDGVDAAEVELSHDGVEATYFVGDRFGDLAVITRQDADGTVFVCSE